MTKHNVTPTDSGTATDNHSDPTGHPPIGIDHPTVDVEYTVRETIEPEYELIQFSDPNSHFDALETTKVSRLERVIKTDDVTHQEINRALTDGKVTFERENVPADSFDPLLERAYIREVGDERAVCVHLRGEFENRGDLSRLLMAIDEALRPVVQP